jgi:hypothetical protein
MNEPGYKKQERKAYYALIYQSGLYQQDSLFKVEDLGDQERSKAFRQFIDQEAKKRDITPLEMIDYFGENKEELTGLLKKKKIEYPKFSKIYTHSEMEDIMHNLLVTQGLKEKSKNLQDKSITETNGAVKVWVGKGVDYIVNVEDIIKLEGKPPKVYVSQKKNLLLLMGMIQEQQYDNAVKEAICTFKLSYYAERRGYTKEEIQQGGNFFNELKRDLLSGAITSYGKILVKGKKYTVFNSFYALYMPDDPGGEWMVEFNNPYKNFVIQILNKEARQQFVKATKAIEDRTTTDKPYLFLFYQQLTERKRNSLITMPVKIGSLLTDMKIRDKMLSRPKDCFNILKECLIYFHEHYQPTPEIESFNIYNDFHKTQTIKLPLNISEAFKELPYEDLKDLLKAIGIKDIRDAYISFKRPPAAIHKKHGHFVLSEADEELINEIMAWAKEWEEYEEGNKIPFTEEERYKFLSDCIKYLGHEALDKSYLEELNRKRENHFGDYHIDDPIGYFTKRLPGMLKEDKLKSQ